MVWGKRAGVLSNRVADLERRLAEAERARDGWEADARGAQTRWHLACQDLEPMLQRAEQAEARLRAVTADWSLRDLFAGFALAGLLGSECFVEWRGLAAMAFQAADAMLRARGRDSGDRA